VCEYYAGTKPKRVIRIGVDDQFGQSGTIDDLITHYGMDIDSIINRVNQALG